MAPPRRWDRPHGGRLSDEPNGRDRGGSPRSTIVVDDDGRRHWPPLPTAAAFGATLFVLWLLVRASTGDRFVPIVDHANLAFHEAGHLLVGLVSGHLAVYGGALGQMFFPVATAWHFARRRHSLGFALTAGWACESALNVATYMGDARALQLPLIGGLDPETHHDWREILTRWGWLEADTALALLTSLAAWGAGVALCFWVMRRWLDGRA